MKKKYLTLMLAILLLSALVGCGGKKVASPAPDSSSAPPQTDAPTGNSSKGLKIGACVMDLTSEYFSESVKGYEAWIAAHPENELTVVDGQGDVAKQVTAVENFIAAGMDAILLNALDSAALEDVVKRAVESGIKVMQYPDTDYVTVGLCNDDYNFGYVQGTEAAKWINEKLGGTATVAFIWNPRNASLLQRTEGQKAALVELCDESKLTFLEPQTCDTAADASKLAENLLVSNPDVRVLLSIGDSQASAFAEVLKAKNVNPDEWFLSGVDGSQEALNMIADGSYGFRCSVAYSLRTPDIAYDLIDNIARAARGEDYAVKYYQDVIPVTAENIDGYSAMEVTYQDRFENYYNYWLEKEQAG